MRQIARYTALADCDASEPPAFAAGYDYFGFRNDHSMNLAYQPVFPYSAGGYYRTQNDAFAIVQLHHFAIAAVALPVSCRDPL